jgi:hypothetical protein
MLESLNFFVLLDRTIAKVSFLKGDAAIGCAAATAWIWAIVSSR